MEKKPKYKKVTRKADRLLEGKEKAYGIKKPASQKRDVLIGTLRSRVGLSKNVKRFAKQPTTVWRISFLETCNYRAEKVIAEIS